ncbi:MAG: hypothetical protein RLZZ350_59 [Verrucomicrobiota bacterium]|jgi:general secretion pathway protein K
MKISSPKNRRGIALIIVMITVFILTALVAAFALSMKVEMKLARNASSDAELEWLGRSGVELGKYVLALQLNSPQEQYDSLNQVWAGGPGSAANSNSVLGTIQLKDHAYHLGSGTFTVKQITDAERKFNINAVSGQGGQDVLNQAFINMGVDAGSYPQIVAAIQDWVDTDDDAHIGGAESSYYQTLAPPYLAKNGPIDDVTELMLVKGITPEMFWGSDSPNVPPPPPSANPFANNSGILSNAVGLVKLFTPISSGYLNLNTASPEVMQLLPGFDANMAQSIIQQRAGPDGIDGTEDDTPFGGTGGPIQNAIQNATGGMQVGQALQRVFRTRSTVFEIEVDAEVGGYHKTYVGIVVRNSPTDVQTLVFHEK